MVQSARQFLQANEMVSCHSKCSPLQMVEFPGGLRFDFKDEAQDVLQAAFIDRNSAALDLLVGLCLCTQLQKFHQACRTRGQAPHSPHPPPHGPTFPHTQARTRPPTTALIVDSIESSMIS